MTIVVNSFPKRIGISGVSHARAAGLALVLIYAFVAVSKARTVDGPSEDKTNGVDEIVANLVRMNVVRAQALRGYHGSRTYRVEYNGFPHHESAQMVVDTSYSWPNKKVFTIRSESGSGLIIDMVFKRLLQGEIEALSVDNQRRSALNNDNYRFRLLRREPTPLGSAYVLSVDPKRKNKFSIRGNIWIDARDYAITHIEAEPAKSPSFWIQRATIQQDYVKVKNFWLPAYNRSTAMLRFGGQSNLTINYRDYVVLDVADGSK